LRVKARRTDSWLGIKSGEVYPATIFKTVNGEKIFVDTDGYKVLYNDQDFTIVEMI
jgi:hypothetical protein